MSWKKNQQFNNRNLFADSAYVYFSPVFVQIFWLHLLLLLSSMAFKIDDDNGFAALRVEVKDQAKGVMLILKMYVLHTICAVNDNWRGIFLAA